MKSSDIKILINLHVFEWMSMDTSIVDRFKFLYSYNVLNNLQQYFIFFLLNCIIKLYLCNIVVCDNKYMTPEIILISFFWVKLMIKVTYSEKKSALFIENMAIIIKIHFTFRYISLNLKNTEERYPQYSKAILIVIIQI